LGSNFRGPERNPAKAGLLATMRHISLVTGGGGFGNFSKAFLSRPRCALQKAGRRFRGRRYPADACGAIFLSFRALGSLLLKI